MAYFLKKSKIKERLYLQIYESFYDPKRGHTAHRSYRPVGYEDNLINEGIENPIEHFQKEVDELNKKSNEEKEVKKTKLIGKSTPEKYVGHFPIKAINDGLNVKEDLDFLQSNRDFEFSVFDTISSLIYARLIKPLSKTKTFHDVIPLLFEDYSFSSSQMYSAVQFAGSEYQKIIEIYNAAISRKYKFDTSKTFFDCTNFYFEIDKEDELRRKGPSKENRKDPIVGMGLLLDANQIPMGMKIFPGNKSEKPVIGAVINDLKQRQSITGRTIRVADKGLNTADNINETLKQNDGYIFSKSVKMLSSKEKTWVLLDQDYKDVLDEDGNVKFRIKECVDTFPYKVMNSFGKKIEKSFTEKRIVSYNPSLAKKKIAEINKQVDKALRLSHAANKKSQYGDSAKYVNFITADSESGELNTSIYASLNEDKINEDKKLAGYNMIVTSETNMSSLDLYSTYHNLWKIEESFRVMKSYLDARPVYARTEESIIGHFLICYLSVVLLRILEVKIFEDEYCSGELIEFIRSFKVVQTSARKYINITKSSKFIDDLSFMTNLPVNVYHLNNTQIKKMLNHRF